MQQIFINADCGRSRCIEKSDLIELPTKSRVKYINNKNIKKIVERKSETASDWGRAELKDGMWEG